MIILGYSTGKPDPTYLDKVRLISQVEKDAIEMGVAGGERLDSKIDNELFDLIRQFKYISIHTPVKINQEWVRYPSQEVERYMDKLLQVAQRVEAQTILFHPDLIDNFDWLYDKIGDRLAFENMDNKKNFGRTVEDMRSVFSQAPQAKFVMDVNHIYTNDPTMELAKDFYAEFKDRLCHYHLSGYGGWHGPLSVTREDIILQGITDFSVPIINEGNATREGIELLKQEDKYVRERLERNN